MDELWANVMDSCHLSKYEVSGGRKRKLRDPCKTLKIDILYS